MLVFDSGTLLENTSEFLGVNICRKEEGNLACGNIKLKAIEQNAQSDLCKSERPKGLETSE
jgi:hypothetical protein